MAPSTGNRAQIIGLSPSGEDYAAWKSFFAEIFLAKGWREKEKSRQRFRMLRFLPDKCCTNIIDEAGMCLLLAQSGHADHAW
jgi:hypothetical protein